MSTRERSRTVSVDFSLIRECAGWHCDCFSARRCVLSHQFPLSVTAYRQPKWEVVCLDSRVAPEPFRAAGSSIYQIRRRIFGGLGSEESGYRLPGSEVLSRRDAAHSLSSFRLMSKMRWKVSPASIRRRIETSSAPGSSSWPLRAWPTTLLPRDSIRRVRLSASGAIASLKNGWPVSRKHLASGVRPAFPLGVAVDRESLVGEPALASFKNS